MANTLPYQAVADWRHVATGPGPVTITPHEQGAHYGITDTGSAPVSPARGHIAVEDEDEPLSLEAGERLYIRGAGQVDVTAAVPGAAATMPG